VLNNTLAAIEDGRRALLPYLAPSDLSAVVVNRLEVIFEEVVSNIVRHGFEPGSGQSIHVTARATPQAIELTFEDDGRPFDPLQLVAPAPFTTLEVAEPGGLGVELVRRLSASVRYEAPMRPRAGDASGFAPRNRLIVSVATRS
jgi:serine/threonine-protein kinase RsbW